MTNPLITQSKEKIEQSVKPADKSAYERIVLAGMKVMYAKETHAKLIEGLDDAPDKITATAEGVIGLLGVLFQQSRNTMPVVPMIMAGVTLMLEALDFLEQAGLLEVTADSLATGTQHYLETLLPKIGMTPEKMQTVLGKTQKVIGDPAQVGEYTKSLGEKA